MSFDANQVPPHLLIKVEQPDHPVRMGPDGPEPPRPTDLDPPDGPEGPRPSDPESHLPPARLMQDHHDEEEDLTSDPG